MGTAYGYDSIINPSFEACQGMVWPLGENSGRFDLRPRKKRTGITMDDSRIPSWNGGLPFVVSGVFPRNALLPSQDHPPKPHVAAVRHPPPGQEIIARASAAPLSPLSASRFDEIALIQSP